MLKNYLVLHLKITSVEKNKLLFSASIWWGVVFFGFFKYPEAIQDVTNCEFPLYNSSLINNLWEEDHYSKTYV